MTNRITRDQLEEWQAHPVTIKVMDRVIAQIKRIKDDFANGVTICESAEETLRRTSKLVGQVEGLNQLLTITPDEEGGTDAGD